MICVQLEDVSVDWNSQTAFELRRGYGLQVGWVTTSNWHAEGTTFAHQHLQLKGLVKR